MLKLQVTDVYSLCRTQITNTFAKLTGKMKRMQTAKSERRDSAGVCRTATSQCGKAAVIAMENRQWTWKTLIFTLQPPLFFVLLFIYAVWSRLRSCIWRRANVIMGAEAAVWMSTSPISNLIVWLTVHWRSSVHWWWVCTLHVRLGCTLLLAEFGASVLEPNLHNGLHEFHTAFTATLKKL